MANEPILQPCQGDKQLCWPEKLPGSEYLPDGLVPNIRPQAAAVKIYRRYVSGFHR
jgi:hypothetical protein